MQYHNNHKQPYSLDNRISRRLSAKQTTETLKSLTGLPVKQTKNSNIISKIEQNKNKWPKESGECCIESMGEIGMPV